MEAESISKEPRAAPSSALTRSLFNLGARAFVAYSRLAAAFHGRSKPQAAEGADAETSTDTNERYRWLTTGGRDVLVEIGADGRFTYVSPNVAAITGYEPSSLLGTSIFNAIHPDDTPTAMKAFLTAVASGKSAEIQVRMRMANGEYRWIEGYGQSYRKSALDIRVFAVVRDVTDRRRAEEAARQSEERLLLHVAQTPVAVIGWDANGKLAEWNPAARSIFGYELDEAIGRDGAELLLPKDAAGLLSSRIGTWKDTARSRRTTQENITKDGRRIICEWHDTPLVASDGTLIGITSIVQDVTERVKAQEALRDSEAAIRSLYEVTSAPHIDFHEKVRAVLGMGCTFFRTRSGLISRFDGKNFEIVAAQTPEDRFQVGDILPLAWMYSSEVVSKNDTVAITHASEEGWASHPAFLRQRLESFIGTPVAIGGELYGTIAFADSEPRSTPFSATEKDFLRLIAQWLGLAIERGEVEAELRYSALHDALTGLPNQRLLNDRLQMAIAHAKRSGNPIAVCFLDLDRFKVVNDTLGHRIGDDLLKAVTKRLAECLRENDTLARLGGDEFVLLLPEVTDTAAAGKIAQRLLDALEQPLVVEGDELFVTASLGVSIYPKDGSDPETLIKNADHAMYRAKDLGRATYQMYSADDGFNRDRLALETSLRRAIKNDELLLHYQPQIDIASGEIVGIEALVRWNHPERGLIAPGDFIPLAEETGLVVPIGAWVMQHACAQVAQWRRLGFPPFRLAVNVSARQFRQRSFVESVETVLRSNSIDPGTLEIELTESVTMHAGEAELDALERLKHLGVRLAMDDFGTGFASLSNLKRFPIDAVKIDRSFVSDCLNSTDDAAIVKAVVSMGHALRLQVTAEGVETKEQLAFLQLLGCDLAQGYLIGRPTDATEFERLIAERSGTAVRRRPNPAA